MTIEALTIYAILPACGYVAGSIPFAWVIGKLNGVDIRTVGSKNIGATNLGRTLGGRYFWYAFVLDAAKGFIPVLVAALLIQHWNLSTLPKWSPLLTGIGCMIGHVFPVWLKFKGGKGVATGFGLVLGFWPLFTLAGLVAGAFFVFMLMVYRMISLSSITSAAVFVFAVAWLSGWDNKYVHTFLLPDQRWPMITVAALFAGLIIFRHRTNITRLLNGTEPKVGQREVDKAKMPPVSSPKP